MTVEEIRELIQLAMDAGIAELEVQRGENRVRIRRGWPGGPEILPSGTHTALARSGRTEAPVEQGAKSAEPELVLVPSPIVGTFYESPSPGAPPFVRAGERVDPGKVLCIIESMKLMNEIEAEVAGIIESRLVQNGQPVEYGEALFAIRPV